MATMTTSMTKKGQVTIPIEVRKALGLTPRDRVVFEIRGKEARIRPVSSDLLAGFGAVQPKERPEDFERMRKEMPEEVAEEVLRELGRA